MKSGSGIALPRIFQWFAAGWLGLWLLFVIAAWIMPAGTQSPFFSDTNDLLRDFLNPMAYAAELDPYRNPVNGLWEKSHPPLFYVMLWGVQKICQTLEPTGNGIYLLAAMMAMMISTIGLLLMIERYSALSPGRRLMLMTMILGSGLFLYAFERGNLVLTAVMLSAFFIFCHHAANRYLRELALLALALAAGLKLAPAIFGALLLYRRDFAGAARLMVYGAIAVFLPFVCMPGTWENLTLLHMSMQENVVLYLNGEMRLGPTALLPLLTRVLAHYDWMIPVDALNRVLMAIFWPLSGLLVLLAWRSPVRWRQVLMLSLLPIIVPGNSNWYNALYLLPALVLFFNGPADRRRDLIFPAACLLLLSPLQLNGWSMILRNLVIFVLFAEVLITGIQDFRRAADTEA